MSKKASKSKSADQDFPFDNDSEDEEPKYLWRNVTKNGCIKKCVLVDGKMELGMDFFISGQKTRFWVIPCITTDYWCKVAEYVLPQYVT